MPSRRRAILSKLAFEVKRDETVADTPIRSMVKRKDYVAALALVNDITEQRIARENAEMGAYLLQVDGLDDEAVQDMVDGLSGFSRRQDLMGVEDQLSIFMEAYDCKADIKELTKCVVDILTKVIEVLPDLESEEEAGSSDEDLGDSDCLLCERAMPLTRHHLFPQELHHRLRKRGRSTAELQTCLMICRPCHSAIHRFITNREMASAYHTRESLLEHEAVQRWIPFIRKQRTVVRAPPKYRS